MKKFPFTTHETDGIPYPGVVLVAEDSDPVPNGRQYIVQGATVLQVRGTVPGIYTGHPEVDTAQSDPVENKKLRLVLLRMAHDNDLRPERPKMKGPQLSYNDRQKKRNPRRRGTVAPETVKARLDMIANL